MNHRLDLHVLGWLLGAVGLFQVVPLAAALVFGEPLAPYAASALLVLVAGATLALQTRTTDLRVRPRDGFVIVGFAWLLASLAGALPYLLTGTLGPVDAVFESISGFTTTGSTVITNIEELPKALLLWRSFTQWIGGMGIILFTIAILPLLGIGGMQLFRAEVPGPVASKVSPRVADTARRLWMIYVGLTLAEFAALWAAGMSRFDALCHALTTMATGGFSTQNASIAAYGSPLIEWILTLFMLLAGVNFVLYFRALTGRSDEVRGDAELHYYFALVGVATFVLTANLIGDGFGVGQALRLAAFQAASLITTTGYASADFEQWSGLAQVILLFLMLPGGMAGSTSGGIKSLRLLLAIRSLRATVDHLIHPHAVRPLKYAGKSVDVSVLADTWAFFAAYLLISLGATLVVAASGYDVATSLSAALTSIGNVGPGLGEIGAMDNFAHFPALTKAALALCMLAGRLEIFTILVLLSPRFWTR